MSDLKRIQFTTTINAPVATVWRLMLGAESYKQWTSAFIEGSKFEGSWEKGHKITFTSPSGDGMVSEIAENKPEEFVSIRHLAYIANGVEVPWGPAYENYSFSAVPEGTKLVIDMDATDGPAA